MVDSRENRERKYKELTHVVMEAEESQDLQSASRIPSRVDSVVLVQV